MFTRGFVTVAILTNAVVGQLCMMPMAFAQGMDVPHEEHMEMTMTPAFPMSPAHCEHCAKIESGDDDQSQQQSGCAGHCLSQAQSTTTSAVSFNAPHIVAAAPMPVTVAFEPQTTLGVVPPVTASPLSIHIDTIVLRL